MARKNNLELSLKKIQNFFERADLKSFTESNFKKILDENRSEWEIPQNKSTRQVLDFLISREDLILNTFLNSYGEKKEVFSWRTDDEYTIISGLKNNSYFSYFSAIYLHQQTLQIPKTIYLNFEHSSIMLSKDESPISQIEIDEAFKKDQRKSNVSFTFNDKKIILTNGKFTDKLGVIIKKNTKQLLKYTDLERTLIDVTVRPVYAGGVFAVLEAYKNAKESVNVNKMLSYLENLNFRYPYHQAIGFYLENAGYKTKDIQLFNRKIELNFYLTYNIRNKEFSNKWKLFYPKGFSKND